MSSTSTAIAVFDISSSSVGGAHVLIEHSQNAPMVRMLVQERRDSDLGEEINIQRFVDDTAKTLEVVIDHIRTADVHHPTLIQVVLGSPWYTSHIRTITYSKNALFTCTKRLVESLIDKEIEHLLKQATDDGETIGKGFKVAEQQLVQMKLNGYEVVDPYGKKVQSLEITLAVTLVPKIVIDRFNSIIRRSYGSRTVNVTTGPYATYIALRDMGAAQTDCAVIDVGEEVTDVAFVKNSLLVSQYTFPIGTYELYRTLSAVTGSSVEARALVEAYRLKKLSPGSARTVEKALKQFSAAWQKALQEVAEKGQYGLRFPAECFVTADARFETIFTSLIADNAFLQHSAGGVTIRARFVSSEQFSSVLKTRDIDRPDAALLIAALFAERLL